MSLIQEVMVCPCGRMPSIYQYHDDSDWRAGCDGTEENGGVCEYGILEVSEDREKVISLWNESVQKQLKSNLLKNSPNVQRDSWDDDMKLPFDNPLFVEGYSKGTSDGLNQALDIVRVEDNGDPATLQEQVLAFLAWQKNPRVHQATCGNDSTHQPLRPYIELDEKVHLFCLDCTYKQSFVGSYFLDAIRNGLHDFDPFKDIGK